MWSFIEEAHEGFSAEEKKRVKAEARPYGDARFVGFDRHTDILHIEVAKFLIEGLDHFSRFKGRDLDSHVPVLNAYLRTYQVFEPIRKTLVGRGLTSIQSTEHSAKRPSMRGSRTFRVTAVAGDGRSAGRALTIRTTVLAVLGSRAIAARVRALFQFFSGI